MIDLRLGERFAARCEPEPMSGCWLWLGAPCSVGYGTFWINGRQERSHRASWMIHHGPIPPGMMVCHRCDNRGCVNPDHLFLGVSRDNVRDMWAKGRASKPPRRKPTYPKAVIDKLLTLVASGETVTFAAKECGLSLGYACELVRGHKRLCDV